MSFGDFMDLVQEDFEESFLEHKNKKFIIKTNHFANIILNDRKFRIFVDESYKYGEVEFETRKVLN